MKPLVIYHANCLDGAAAALAAWLKFGDAAEYRPASYGDPAPADDEVRGRDVYVLDFSYSRAELERMQRSAIRYDGTGQSRGGSIWVGDHHMTAQVDLAGFPFCAFDMSKSGAVLAWEHFSSGYGCGARRTGPACDKNALECCLMRRHAGKCEYIDERKIVHPALPELFAYVQDRDLCRWELPHSKEVSAALAASGALTDFRALIPIYNDCRFSPISESLMQDGATILRAERLMVERMVATAEEVTLEYEYRAKDHNGKNALIQGEVFALAACSSVLQSEVGEALALESARRGRDAIGVVYYKDGPSGKWRVSLRSRDIVENVPRKTNEPWDNPGTRAIPAPDVSAIAKAFGGGGDQREAECEVDLLPWNK